MLSLYWFQITGQQQHLRAFASAFGARPPPFLDPLREWDALRRKNPPNPLNPLSSLGNSLNSPPAHPTTASTGLTGLGTGHHPHSGGDWVTGPLGDPQRRHLSQQQQLQQQQSSCNTANSNTTTPNSGTQTNLPHWRIRYEQLRMFTIWSCRILCRLPFQRPRSKLCLSCIYLLYATVWTSAYTKSP